MDNLDRARLAHAMRQAGEALMSISTVLLEERQHTSRGGSPNEAFMDLPLGDRVLRVLAEAGPLGLSVAEISGLTQMTEGAIRAYLYNRDQNSVQQRRINKRRVRWTLPHSSLPQNAREPVMA